MIRIVMDTNILVSALLTPNGNPARILDLVIKKDILLCLDTRILNEYSEVLNRKKFRFNPNDVKALLLFLEKESELVIPKSFNIILPDEDDLPFYEVAMTAKVDYLITGNKSHFPELDWIVNPSEFFRVIHDQS